jgi:integrase
VDFIIVDLIRTLPPSQVIELVKILVIFTSSKSTKNTGNPKFTIQIDLKKADIPYQDEMGRYADFHSVSYTWGTYLQRNGVNSRTAMELMRHSDRKLTDKIYTDSNLLPTGEVIRNLPDDEPLTD